MEYNEVNSLLKNHLKEVYASAVTHMHTHPGAVASVLVYLQRQGIIEFVDKNVQAELIVEKTKVVEPVSKPKKDVLTSLRHGEFERYPVTLYKKTMSCQYGPEASGYRYYNFSNVRSSMIAGGYNTIQLDIITPSGIQYRATLTLSQLGVNNITVPATHNNLVDTNSKWGRHFTRI